MTGFIGALVEAWAEFRVNRARVILSLVGVAVAVLALTGVVGIGNIATQAQIEQLERGSGRPATLTVMPPVDPATGQQAEPERFADTIRQIADRYSITYSGLVRNEQVTGQLPFGAVGIDTQIVEPDFGVMHRIELAEGSWFTDRDAERLLPAVIVNDYIWQQLGRPALDTHPRITLYGDRTTAALIIGVEPPRVYEQYPRQYILGAGWDELRVPAPPWGGGWSQYEMWVPPALADPLTERISAELRGAFGDTWDVTVQRVDYLAWQDGVDPLGPVRLILIGIAGLILLLGALGLVNISLVTVRQRIREIGIRRAFGATAGRVFLAVMLESVVATVVAGFVGIVLAIILVRNDFVMQYIAPGLTDIPPFPAEAALIGFAAATGVGALAGLLPALVAVRVKVIDAIRY